MVEVTSYEPGTPSFIDLATTDLGAAKAFYCELFGWDAEDMLVGVLHLHKLVLARPEQVIQHLMDPSRFSVTPHVDQERVARMFKRYDLVALPVVDVDNRLLGRILHDDVVDVLQEEADEDIMHMAGATTHEPELVYTDQMLKIAGVRLPWLLATLAGLTVPALLVLLVWVSAQDAIITHLLCCNT